MAIKEKENAPKYINPYNFISLDTENGCRKKNIDEISEEQNLTGYIECVLETKTPTIIPDIKSAKEEIIKNGAKHPRYSFFNYDEKIENTNIIKPVIPGSEIRGMLRSDFEALTNSCLSSVNMDKKFVARTPKAKLPGLLKQDENQKWHLYEAKRVRLKTTRNNNIKNSSSLFYKDDNNEIVLENKKLKTGDKVYLTYKGKNTALSLVSMSLKNNDGKKECGYLFIGEEGGTKKYDSIFVVQEEIRNLIDLDKSVDALEDIYDIYNDDAINKDMDKRKRNKWYPGYDLESNDYIPVWYEKINNRVYLSQASIGKEAYFRNLNSLLNVGNNSYRPCIDKTNICEACYLFGYVSDEDASGSKIRVTDANYIGSENPYLGFRTLQELSTPRTSNPVFYSLYLTNKDLVKQNKNDIFTNWNYDYKYDNKKSLLNDNEIKARGRKMYWHHLPKEVNNVEKTKRNCTVQPIKEGCKFEFRIYFDKISETNLKHLIATLTLNYDSEHNDYYDLCHKIGRGKPLGYGSIKISINDVVQKELSIVNNKFNYNLVSKNNYNNITINECPLDTKSETFKDILKIYNFNYLSKNYPKSIIDYPLGELNNKTYGYLWSLLNRGAKIGKPYLYMVLPKISEGGDIIENEEREKGAIKQNNELVLNIDGLNIPLLKQTK